MWHFLKWLGNGNGLVLALLLKRCLLHLPSVPQACNSNNILLPTIIKIRLTGNYTKPDYHSNQT
ncbi:hypothetical protein, partial [Legionella quinlivanii]|uniref:hypothetical protein n=1 Tax=Legionella quinlivanii TaxID=45073 RepID=UPI000AFD7845